jgi:hypothetical protein
VLPLFHRELQTLKQVDAFGDDPYVGFKSDLVVMLSGVFTQPGSTTAVPRMSAVRRVQLNEQTQSRWSANVNSL